MSDFGLDVDCHLDMMERSAVETLKENLDKIIGSGPMSQPAKSAFNKILGEENENN